MNRENKKLKTVDKTCTEREKCDYVKCMQNISNVAQIKLK